MSGIAGIIAAAPENRDPAMLARMIRAMSSRPDEGSSQYSWSSVLVGWLHHSTTSNEHIPIWNEDRTVALIFTGEEYDYANARSSVSAILKLYDKLGTAFYSHLNGWFSGLLIDLRRDTATLFNDRYGMGRVYYHEANQTFAFASAARSLLAILPATRELNQQSLAEYISVGCVLQNRSLYRNIHLLPPGSAWTFHRNGRLEKQTYFNPTAWEQQERLTASAYSDQLRDVFCRVLPRYFAGEQKTALSLTGGLDSRMVLAWAKAAPGTLPCYTFGGPYRECADVTIARQLARLTEQSHSVLPIEPDFFSNFGELAAETIRVSDGTMDVSGAVELYMNRKAASIAPVRLTGNYGSEILRSNVAFRPRQLDRTLYTPEFNQLLDGAEQTYRSEAKGHRLSFIAFKQVPWHHYSRYSIEKVLLSPRSPFLDNDLVALAYRAPQGQETSAEPLLQLISDGNALLGKQLSDRALHQGRTNFYITLRRQWQEFTAKAEYAYDYGMPQQLARTDRMVAKLHLERLFLGRHKFYHFRLWYRDALAKYLHELDVSTPQAMVGFRSGSPARLIREHTTGRANHTLDLHRISSLSLMNQMFSVNSWDI